MSDLVDGLVAVLEHRRSGRRLLVAVDGPDAAGKTTLARALTGRIDDAVCVSIDGWHQPRALRRDYYRDSFDLASLVTDCLQPFAAGAARIRTACFDHVADAPVDERVDGPAKAVLVVEGVFLLRPELRPWWDVTVHLHVPEPVTMARAVARDVPLLGSELEVRRRYEERYLPAQAHYRAVADPHSYADVLVDNSDPAQPRVLRWP